MPLLCTESGILAGVTGGLALVVSLPAAECSMSPPPRSRSSNLWRLVDAATKPLPLCVPVEDQDEMLLTCWLQIDGAVTQIYSELLDPDAQVATVAGQSAWYGECAACWLRNLSWLYLSLWLFHSSFCRHQCPAAQVAQQQHDLQVGMLTPTDLPVLLVVLLLSCYVVDFASLLEHCTIRSKTGIEQLLYCDVLIFLRVFCARASLHLVVVLIRAT